MDYQNHVRQEHGSGLVHRQGIHEGARCVHGQMGIRGQRSKNGQQCGEEGLHTRPINSNPITYQQMVEGVVDQSVSNKYINEILLLMDWAFVNQQDWLPEEVLSAYPTITRQMIDENYTHCRKRIKDHYTMLLNNAKNVPVFKVENITVQWFMEYLASQAHYLTGRVLKVEVMVSHLTFDTWLNSNLFENIQKKWLKT